MMIRFAALLLWIAPLVLAQEKNVSHVADVPKWEQLDAFQKTIGKKEFLSLLHSIYTKPLATKNLIQVKEDHVLIRKWNVEGNEDYYRLEFADKSEQKPIPRYWKPSWSLEKPSKEELPFEGLHIAIDPGHIGGEWARMEERWFQIGEGKPVMEGEMALFTGQLLKSELEKRGAKVTMIRETNDPVTKKRPSDFVDIAKDYLINEKKRTDPKEDFDGPADPQRYWTIRWQSEKMFYRSEEIRERGRIVNNDIKPDVVICIHFNAESWGDPANPQLVDKNHLHLLINGTYGIDEVAKDDIRFEMLTKLLQRTYYEEVALSGLVARSMAGHTSLEPYVYTGTNAKRINRNPYIYARNLLANRVFLCPVVFLEPYVMNSKDVYARVQEGHYEGEKEIDGKMRPSIFSEYVSGIAEGMEKFYRARRKK